MSRQSRIADAARLDKAEEFILQNHTVAVCIDRISRSYGIPLVRGGPITASEVEKVARDAFLCRALKRTLIRGLLLEIFFTYLRKALLRMVPQTIDGNIVTLFSALAQQCFINEYVYMIGDDEARQIADFRAAILQQMVDGTAIEPIMLIAVAAYRPLNSLPNAAKLLERKWPQSIAELLLQQIEEPLKESDERGSISALTAIDDSVSLQVRQQYEENPYPRWTTSLPPIGKSELEDADILIAGCGTGKHVLDIAQSSRKARILAIDISVSSLAYAKRKTREAGLHNVEYAQADILKLGTIERRFDHIEAVGVLHHLADPKAGWRLLLSLLRPDGTMHIGLYSQLARRAILDARTIIAHEGYQPTAAGIRAMRQTMRRDESRWKSITSFCSDFYCMSGCRDLLFNVMEHRFDISDIAAFLKDQNLKFLGFELPADTVERFQRQYPGALLDLDCWHAFESDNPSTFRFMYQFTVRK